MGQDEGIEPVVLVAGAAVTGPQRGDLPGRDDHNLETVSQQVFDDRPVTTLDPDPAHPVPGQQGGDSAQPGPRVGESGFLDPASDGINAGKPWRIALWPICTSRATGPGNFQPGHPTG
ncbi:hypothetical protein QRY02_00845 [Amycolatopsis sp. DG1A-15b]|nr:hypothetical protein [Amycolatopsis sp. DG1A-15b]WIX89030.1 hypothetical protein QRY02_00845 [Amycolatopsis sp. DG1A-15b]